MKKKKSDVNKQTDAIENHLKEHPEDTESRKQLIDGIIDEDMQEDDW